MPIFAFIIATLFGVVFILFGHPWLALVSFCGPTLAWVLSILGVSGAGILTVLSGGGAFPIVAGIGFLITMALAIYSYFI